MAELFGKLRGHKLELNRLRAEEAQGKNKTLAFKSEHSKSKSSEKDEESEDGDSDDEDMIHMCYGCGEKGHVNADCPNLKRGEEKKSFKKKTAYAAWEENDSSSTSSSVSNEEANLCLTLNIDDSTSQVTAITKSQDLTSIPMAELFGKLRGHKLELNRLRAEEAQGKNKTLAFKSEHSKSKSSEKDEESEDGDSDDEDMIHMCYGCGEKGHVNADCPNLKRGEEKKSFKKKTAYAAWEENDSSSTSSSVSNEEANLCLTLNIDDSTSQVTAITKSQDLTSIPMAELFGKLRGHKLELNRLRAEEAQGKNKTLAFKSEHSKSKSSEKDEESEDGDSDDEDMIHMCYGCGEKGHVNADCPNLKRGEEKKSFKKKTAYAAWEENDSSSTSSSVSNEEANLCLTLNIDDSTSQVTAITKSQDLTSIPMAELFGKLRGHKLELNRLRAEEAQGKNKTLAFKSEHSKSKSSEKDEESEDGDSDDEDMIHMCYGCGEKGHVNADCPNLKRGEEKKSFKKKTAYAAWEENDSSSTSSSVSNEEANLCLTLNIDDSTSQVTLRDTVLPLVMIGRVLGSCLWVTNA
ncbi:uncharacterized protein LOC128197520 [Vigna angularis]|uniref:uncharacterized protein LOC128197520 n=1 Tax=Phaseolus angularis TaxID=3914 RepID=UPI0022B3833B|nr:uncharacterized protein LOC128197520 [Vigna angularis]